MSETTEDKKLCPLIAIKRPEKPDFKGRQLRWDGSHQMLGDFLSWICSNHPLPFAAGGVKPILWGEGWVVSIRLLR